MGRAWLMVPDRLVWVFIKLLILLKFPTLQSQEFIHIRAIIKKQPVLKTETPCGWGTSVKNGHTGWCWQKGCGNSGNRSLILVSRTASQKEHFKTWGGWCSSAVHVRFQPWTEIWGGSGQNWTDEDWLTGLISLDFCWGCRWWRVSSRNPRNQPALCPGCWWCNGLGIFFLTLFGLLSTNQSLFECHIMSRYCCWSCGSLYRHDLPSFNGCINGVKLT